MIKIKKKKFQNHQKKSLWSFILLLREILGQKYFLKILSFKFGFCSKKFELILKI
jgi:hypothetical protein